MSAMRVKRGKLHLNGRDTPVGTALEVGKVPSGSDEVGAHALDGVDEHADALDTSGLTFEDDVTACDAVRPKAMDDVSIGLIHVWTKVRKPSFRSLADFETGYRGGTGNVKG